MVGKRLCISCYNREREVIKGKNRNGNKPGLTLFEAAIFSQDRVVSTYSVASVLEAGIAALKSGQGDWTVRATFCPPLYQDMDFFQAFNVEPPITGRKASYKRRYRQKVMAEYQHTHNPLLLRGIKRDKNTSGNKGKQLCIFP